MTITFTTVEQTTRQSGVKLLVYGKPKVGKTSLIASCPNPLIISAERGLLSLRNMPNMGKVPVIEVHGMSEFEEVFQWCLKSADAKKFDTFALDSITEIAEVCLLEEKAITRAKAKGGKPNNFEPYAELQEKIMGALRGFRDMPNKNVLFIGQEEFDKDETTGMMIYRPVMPGKQLTRQLPYVFDEILQLVRFTTPEGQPYNALRTIADAQNTAGDRSGKLDPWEQADISQIIRKIIG
jgi:hypothetical protein